MLMLRMSNAPLFVEGMVTRPFTDTVQWAFNDRRVVWVQVKDGVGNWSKPYPAYAASPVTPLKRQVYLPLVLK